jgi:Family of unknown function (DUF6557)
MTTLRDLVLGVQEAAVVEAIARFYDQRETQWLPDAVSDVLGQLRKLAPNPAGSRNQLSIELTPPVDPKDKPFWDVSCIKEGDPARCGLDLSPWDEWLALRVPQSLLDKMTAAEIVAHCVWEMTFYGFTQEKIAAFRAELECSVKEID